ncbi:MAG: hypothetical protein AB7O60_14060 [Variibacter sp.]
MAQAESENITIKPADENRPIRKLVYDLEDFITRTEGFADAAAEIAAGAPNGDRAGSGLIAITGSMVAEMKAMREHFDLMVEEVRDVKRASPSRDVDAESKIYDLAHMAILTEAVIGESLIAGKVDADGYLRCLLAEWERDMILFAVGHVAEMAKQIRSHVCDGYRPKAA